MLTASGDEASVLRGCRLGADDYVTKPFSYKQLAARIRAVARRSSESALTEPAHELAVGDLVLDLQSYEVRKAGRVVHLTRLEFRILYLLAQNVGRVIPYTRLVEYAWGYDGGDSSLLKTHICHLRKKLGLPATGGGSITAVPGVGYRFNRS